MGKRVRIDLDKDVLVKLREMGKTRSEIAKFFNVSPCVVSYNVKRYGIQMDRKIVIDSEELTRCFNEGMSVDKLCDYFNVSVKVMERNLQENGLKRTKDEILKNTKKTLQEKHGEDLTEYYKGVREQAFKTWQEKTGLENPYKDPLLNEKRVKTNLKKYGSKNPSQNDNVKAKTKATNTVRYGGASPSHSQKVKEKIKQTYYERTGYTNPSFNPEVIKKRKETCEALYGTPNYNQADFGEKAKSVLLNKDSFENYLKTCGFNTTIDIANDLGVSCSTIVKTAAKFDLKGYAIVNTSRGEQEVRTFIESLGVKTIHAKGTVIPHLDIDIYCPDYNIGVEYNGLYWHSDLIVDDKLYHYKKCKACSDKQIRLINVYEDEWDNPVKREIVKSLIKISLGKVDSKIYARNCVVKEITNTEAKVFNNANHIQGHRNAKITYGLFYHGELVQLMSFSWNSHYAAWEIIRGCPGSNNIVIGGISKLFKHFIRENNPDRIFSYCDYNKFDGSGYEAIGMKCIGETKYNKWYVINNVRHERNPRKYQLYKKNRECIIYGAGSKKYLWEKSDETKSN